MVNIHRPMAHVTYPKSDPFDPLTHEPSTRCLLCSRRSSNPLDTNSRYIDAFGISFTALSVPQPSG